MDKTQTRLELITKYFSNFSSKQLHQLSDLENLYKEWNKKINVISRKDMDQFYERHVLHSLSIAAAFSFDPGTKILDLGTGGGFPGIPLAIFFPDVKFHLVDSIGKKIKVVKAVAEAIGLHNVSAEQTRAEDLKGRKFDFVVCRAVASLKELWTWTKPLLQKGSHGGLLCMKGGDLSSEIAESGCKPKVIEIYKLFPEDFFKEKFLLFVSKTAIST
jgi:16S rRNA (guanine527-N7)-methyltransferase